jgi:lipoprotein-anchoring transpeptidase ErfK/SrfK
MRRLVPVGLAWLIALILVATPLMSAAPLIASAQTEEGTPAAVESPTDAPTEAPTEPVVTETPTAPEATPDTPTDTPTGESSPTVEPSPTESPAETATPVATETVKPTATATATEEESEFTASASLSDITISLKCTTAPESIRVYNNGTEAIQLSGIGTYKDLIGGEPFTISRNLKPGTSALFQAGDGAQYGTVLTDRFILTNSYYDAEGVKVTTSVGIASKMCPPKPLPPLGKLTDLKITLSCNTYAEVIKVSNNGTGYITVKGIATYLDPIAAEPFAVSRVLKPGQTGTFSAGWGAQYGTILTKRYIFTNSAWDKEGVRVNTDVGKAYKSCPPKPVPPVHWIEVNLSLQYLTAWEGNTKVKGTLVSTGKPGFDTPTGTYYILTRYRYQTMSGCIQGECYYVPDVPFVQYFTNYGHALHGAYWHNDFGNVRSHGCVNLPLPFAEWLWYWATYGTKVWIHY